MTLVPQTQDLQAEAILAQIVWVSYCDTGSNIWAYPCILLSCRNGHYYNTGMAVMCFGIFT